MTKIYYKKWIMNLYYEECCITVDDITIPKDGYDIVITGNEDTICYLSDIFGGSISYDKRHLLLAGMPEEVIRYEDGK